MSDPALGLLMLALIVVVIMMGFATAFTLMGLGMFFGFIAFYDPSQPWAHNRVFDLMVQRTYGAMTPISTTTAPTRPLAMPQNVQTIRVATASEAGTRRNASWIE